MPKLWTDTVAAHRAAVRDATLDAAAALVAEHGLTGVTMSRIAEATGIGRATLYKYFPDVQAILLAWHERHVQRHLDHLTAIRDQSGEPGDRLAAALTAYAGMARHRPGGEHGGSLAVMLHRNGHVSAAHEHLHALIRDLITDAVRAGHVRGDIPAGELATYCLHALGAATASTGPAAHRLVTVVLDGLHHRS
ncbi:TetR/AcrR family transcriptional regulator [Micromonospora purpureochromogenes]|uniref:TetR/AcrR family transcriptional regulator n=1 Tax=Micromonospora purpureochromogenes TaxID=47872 RepID=UPI0033ECB30C